VIANGFRASDLISCRTIHYPLRSSMRICRSNSAEAPSQSARIEFLHTKQIDSSKIKAANRLFFIDYFVHTIA